jgi:hypothetical protein
MCCLPHHGRIVSRAGGHRHGWLSTDIAIWEPGALSSGLYIQAGLIQQQLTSIIQPSFTSFRHLVRCLLLYFHSHPFFPSAVRITYNTFQHVRSICRSCACRPLHHRSFARRYPRSSWRQGFQPGLLGYVIDQFIRLPASSTTYTISQWTPLLPATALPSRPANKMPPSFETMRLRRTS